MENLKGKNLFDINDIINETPENAKTSSGSIWELMTKGSRLLSKRLKNTTEKDAEEFLEMWNVYDSSIVEDTMLKETNIEERDDKRI